MKEEANSPDDENKAVGDPYADGAGNANSNEAAATNVHGAPIPMRSLYERIDQVRAIRKDLPSQLRNIAQELPSSSTRRTLTRLAADVEQNTPSSTIVAKYPDHCWLLTVQSCAATTDALTAMLEQSAYQISLQKKKIRAVVYPLLLLMMSTVMVLLACVFLIPPFDEMYEEFALRLPPQTQMVISLSRFVISDPITVAVLLLVGFGLLTGLLWLWIGNGKLKSKLTGVTMDRPSARQALAKVALQCAELCDEGLSTSHALKICAESSSNSTLRSVLGDLAVQTTLQSGNLHRTRSAMLLPPNFLLAMDPSTALPGSAHRSRDESATHPNTTMLRELSASYRDLTVQYKDWTSIALGQMAVIGVGLMIAFVVLSLFSPMVSLVTSLSG